MQYEAGAMTCISSDVVFRAITFFPVLHGSIGIYLCLHVLRLVVTLASTLDIRDIAGICAHKRHWK